MKKHIQRNAQYSTLQKDLLHAIHVLIKTDQHARELKAISNTLKNVTIPNQDYLQVLNFIMILLHQEPQIMDNPNDYALKKLCLRCIYSID